MSTEPPLGPLLGFQLLFDCPRQVARLADAYSAGTHSGFGA